MQNYLIKNGIKESTAKSYNVFYNKIVNNAFDQKEPKDFFSDETIDTIINYLNISDYKKSTRISSARAWRAIGLIKNKEKKLPLDSKKLLDYVNQDKENPFQEPSEKETCNKISLEYVISKREEYKNKLKKEFTINDTYYLLCSLYTYLPPLRSQDYYDTIIKKNDTNVKKDNYYDIETKQLVLNNYKTSKTYGQRVVNFPDVLHKIVVNYHNKSKSPYFICSRTGNQLDSNTFNKTFGRCLRNNHVSSSMLRKCFISQKIDAGVSATERTEAAKIMGHSVATQNTAYSKFSDMLHPDKDDMTQLLRRREQLRKQIQENSDDIKNFINKQIKKTKIL
jgi:hypothetical protein